MSYPAQITFTESERGGFWAGRLLRPSACVDVYSHDRPVTWTPFFNISEGHNGRFYVTVQGRNPGGRRYLTFTDLTKAQKAGIRWAARRFRIPKESQ